MKHLKEPTKRFKQKIITWVQKAFRRTYRDTPASEISNNSLADAINVLPFDSRVEVRHGTLPTSGNTVAPLLPFTTGRTDYDATKSGFTITKTAGQDFTADDVGSYFIWPGTNVLDLIRGFIDANNVLVSDNVAKGPTTATKGKIRGRINGKYFHKQTKVSYLHIGTEVYSVNDTFDIYTLVIQNFGGTLTNKKSTFKEYRGRVYLATEDGQFVVDESETESYLIQTNSDNKINELRNIPNGNQDISDHFARRYLYSFTRMNGSYYNDRITNTIIKETGSNLINPINNQDYKTQFYKNEIRLDPFDNTNLEGYNNGGNYTSIQGIILTQPLSFFQAQTNVGVFAKFQVNGVLIGREVRFNPGLAGSFEKLALIIEEAIRITYPDADGLAEVVVNTSASGVSLEFNGGSFHGSNTTGFLRFITGGTTTGTATNKLINAIGGFITSNVRVGNIVELNSTGARASILVVDSDTELTLSSDLFTIHPEAYLILVSNDIAVDLGLQDLTAVVSEAPAEHVGHSDFIFGGSGDALGALAPDNKLESQWTHVSIYGTVNSLISTNNVAQYAWLFDRPLCKALLVSVTANGLVTAQQGVFKLEDVGQSLIVEAATGSSQLIKQFISSSQVRIAEATEGITTSLNTNAVQDSTGPFVVGDVGSEIVNPITGLSATVTAFVTAFSLTLDADIFTEIGHRYELYNIAALVGVKPVNTQATIGARTSYKMGQSGTTVTVVTDTPFVSGDVGRAIFWSDGKTSIIISFTSSSVVEVGDSNTRVNLAAAYDILDWGIGFNDVITDDVLIDRVSDFPLRTRFWTALPGGRFAAFAPGFYFVANRGESDFLYSQLSQNFEYLGGHHYRPYQQSPIQDRIQGLEEFPEQTIVYGSKSTWRINTNTTNLVAIPEVGEIVALISGVALVDGDIGIIDDGGLQTIDNGEQVVITSEPGIRVFDGYKYGENLAIDKEGRPMFLDDLEALHKVYATAYDKTMGFIFWGGVGAIPTFWTEDIVPLTKCFRVGIRQEQARGWGEINGAGWIFSNSRVGGHHVFTDTEEEALYLFDEAVDGRVYRLLKGIEFDKFDPEQRDGTEIPWSIKFKEHKASRESFRIKHLISHFYFRPSNSIALGFDRNVIAVSAAIDGSNTPTVTVAGIPIQNEIAFDNVAEGNRIQLTLSGTASGLILVEHDTDYTEINTRALPARRQVSWQNYQGNLANVLFWMARSNESITLDKATCLEPLEFPAGYVPTSGLSEIKGPDEGLKTALFFNQNNFLNYTSIIGPSNSGFGDFSIILFCKFIFFGGAVTIKVFEIGTSYIFFRSGIVGFFDGFTERTVVVPSFGSSWIAIRLSRLRPNNVLFTYTLQVNSDVDNGADIETGVDFVVVPVVSEVKITFTGSVKFGNTLGEISLFDPRYIDNAISKDAFDYYRADVVDLTHSNGLGGQKVLPHVSEPDTTIPEET